MGLPLFVAPVESDLPKTARKTTSSSPPRSAIRRLARVNAGRDYVSLQRRARTLEHHERRRAFPGLDEIGAATSPASPADVATVARYISMGFMSPSDLGRLDTERDQRRAALMENMEARFGPGWRNRDWENPQQDLSSDWWAVQPRLQNGSARLTRLMGHRFDFGRSRSRPRHIEIVPSAAWSNLSSNTRTAPYRASPLGGPLHSERPVPRRAVPNDVNGLGDRERSLSPEGWDTLLTTLTPDPQPPSASSSFVSAAASQNAGASTNTSMSAQPTAAETAAPEPPCDSGCENSDSEENDQPYRRRSTTRNPSFSRRLARPVEPPIDGGFGGFRFHVPNYNTDRPGDEALSLAIPIAHLAALHDRRSSPLRHRAGEPEGFTTQPEGRVRHGIWIGHLSVGADEEPGADRSQRSREGSSGAGNTATSSGEEEWMGMQRIVRSLVQREDIPDEWWAEAGLNRILSRQGRE